VAVLVRWLVLISALTLFVAGCGSGDNDTTTEPTPAINGGKARAVAGDWTGHLHQEGLAPFRIAVRIEPSGNGQVAYTGIDCAGEWKPRGIMEPQSHYYDFVERITRGAGSQCKGTGRVNTYLDATLGEQRLDYEFKGGGVTSRGFLRRTDAAGLKPIFDEAGVTPP
jgi:hypothetical protein